jgi:hypothetical protein
MFSFCSSRPLHHLTSFASPFAASQERCAQRATSREQRTLAMSSRVLDLLTSSPASLSAWFSRGFRTAKIGEGIAAPQHTLPSCSQRGTFLSNVFVFHSFGVLRRGKLRTSREQRSWRLQLRRCATPCVGFLIALYSVKEIFRSTLVGCRTRISRRRLGASRQDGARAGSARREIVDSRNDDVDANLMRQGASR